MTSLYRFTDLEYNSATIPSNVWLVHWKSIISQFLPLEVAHTKDILDYFTVLNEDIIYSIIAMSLIFIFIIVKYSDNCKEIFWNAIDVLLQGNVIKFLKFNLIKILFYLILSMFLKIFLNHLIIDMVVDNVRIPIDGLNDILDERSDHVRVIWERSTHLESYHVLNSKKVKDTVYKRVLKRGAYCNAEGCSFPVVSVGIP